MEKELFTAPEIAKICKVSRFTVNHWINKGILKAFRPMEKGVWKVRRKDFITFMEKSGYPSEFLNGDKIKILVIDDEEIITETIERAFKNVSEFNIEIANSGFIAGAKLESFKPDVVLLDIFLGDMDGREFFNHIRKHPELNGIKVIGISGNLPESEIQPLLDDGFDNFLLKPFRMNELKKAIIKTVED